MYLPNRLLSDPCKEKHVFLRIQYYIIQWNWNCIKKFLESVYNISKEANRLSNQLSFPIVFPKSFTRGQKYATAPPLRPYMNKMKYVQNRFIVSAISLWKLYYLVSVLRTMHCIYRSPFFSNKYQLLLTVLFYNVELWLLTHYSTCKNKSL